MLLGLIFGIFGSLAALGAAAVVFHAKKSKSPMKTLRKCFIFGIFAAIFLAFYASRFTPAFPFWLENLSFIVVTVFVFVIISLSYFNFYALIEFSITFRILYHFLQQDQHKLSKQGLCELYPFEEVLQRKITNTAAAKVISLKLDESSQQVIVPSEKSYRMGKVFSHIKTFLNWGDGG